MQWNVYVPAVLNFVVLLLPAAMFPVSQSPGVSLVDVWTVASSLRQVMVVPTGTVMLMGLKLKLLMTNVFAGVRDGGGGPTPSGPDIELLLQPEAAIVATASPISRYDNNRRAIYPPDSIKRVEFSTARLVV